MFLSVVIPTLNSEKTLAECLAAIRAQSLSRDSYEIVIADAGSSDRTLAIARDYGVETVTDNPLKTGEAGKTAGIKAAKGDVIALVDSDNILPDPHWLERMLAPFADPDILATEPLEYTCRREDPPLTRYFALLGMNDPICLFTGNYDRICRDGAVSVAKVKTGIVHLYCARFGDFVRKQRRRIRDFLYFAQEKARIYPWDRQRKTGIILFCLATVFVLPLLWQTLKGAVRRPDRAWLYHVPVCWITLWVYGLGTLSKVFGRKQAPVDRSSWQKQ